MIFVTLSIILAILGGIFLQGLKKIPADPPHKGQRTWLGKRVSGKFANEGWNFFFGYPFFQGFILVKMERITFEVISEKTRTPDRAESKVPITITFRPDSSHLIEYIDSGQEEGVKKQLTGRIRERIREWAIGSEEGPTTWVELTGLQQEAVSVLIREIAGEKLTKIPEYAQEVPTWIWLRYFARPQPTKPWKNEQKWHAKNWKRVEDVLSSLSTTEVENLKAIVEERRREVERLSAGAGKITMEDLGIILERLNVGDIDVLGKVAEQAEDEAKEEQQRKAEELELRFVRERMEELLKPPFSFSPAEARDLVQTERGKVVRAINDQRISTDTTTAEIVAMVLKGGTK